METKLTKTNIQRATESLDKLHLGEYLKLGARFGDLEVKETEVGFNVTIQVGHKLGVNPLLVLSSFPSVESIRDVISSALNAHLPELRSKHMQLSDIVLMQLRKDLEEDLKNKKSLLISDETTKEAN